MMHYQSNSCLRSIDKGQCHKTPQKTDCEARNFAKDRVERVWVAKLCASSGQYAILTIYQDIHAGLGAYMPQKTCSMQRRNTMKFERNWQIAFVDIAQDATSLIMFGGKS
jgi:hypothetical protein